MNDGDKVWDALTKVYKPRSRDEIIEALSAKLIQELSDEIDEEILQDLLK